MKKEDCNYRYDWDYLGWIGSDFYDNQNDWNQTIVTKINQNSASIHQSSFASGASFVLINLKTFPLFYNHDYFHPEDDTLSGRYNIIIDDGVPDNTIFVLHRYIIDGVKVIPNFTHPQDEFFADIEFIPVDLVSDDELKKYKSSLCGCITINNY